MHPRRALELQIRAVVAQKDHPEWIFIGMLVDLALEEDALVNSVEQLQAK